MLNNSVLLEPVNIFTWLLLRLGSSPAFFCRLIFKKAFSLPWSLYRQPCVQSLINPLATFADILSAGSGPMSGYEEPSLANWSAVSLPSIPVCPGYNISWTLLCPASFTSNWWQSQTGWEFIWKLLSTLVAALTISENMYVSTFVALFHILYYACLDGHISVRNTVVWMPRLKLCPFFESHLYTPAPPPSLVLDMSVYQTRPPCCLV